MSDKTIEPPKEEDVGLIALDEGEVLLTAENLPEMSEEAALGAYRMMMSGIISRLFLYLYGEVDRQLAETALAAVDERLAVYREIISQKVAPARAVYEYLIKYEIIEREELGVEANAHLDTPDTLQTRIVSDQQDASPTYSVPSEVNLVHVGPPAVIAEIGTADPSKVTYWGPRTEMGVQSVLQDWAKIHLNGDLGPKVSSPYSLLYEPNKLGE